ncbi:hypothetical protein D3C85_901830 [compost metagenome]
MGNNVIKHNLSIIYQTNKFIDIVKYGCLALFDGNTLVENSKERKVIVRRTINTHNRYCSHSANSFKAHFEHFYGTFFKIEGCLYLIHKATFGLKSHRIYTYISSPSARHFPYCFHYIHFMWVQRINFIYRLCFFEPII